LLKLGPSIAHCHIGLTSISLAVLQGNQRQLSVT
jgi:hypothetical protein